MRILLFGLSCLLVGMPAAAKPLLEKTARPTSTKRTEKHVAACDERVARSIRYFHMDPGDIDRKAICKKVHEMAAAGRPSTAIDDFYHSEFRKVRFAFATPGKNHDPRARYRFPYEVWMPRLLSQTSGGKTHNTQEAYHAFDFLMPTGTRILAARAGTVVEVADGTPEGVPWEEDGGNVVRIFHADGSWAIYAHLQKGIPVKVGQKVKRGQFLAWSGNTGFSETPHLHFGVQRLDPAGEIHAVEVRFGPPGKPGRKLVAGQHWGKLPPSRRELRVFVNGKRSKPNAAIPARYGARVDLRVERVEPDGSTANVTTDPRLRYETMTVWNLYSPERGKLIVEALPEIDKKYIQKALPLLNQSEGLLFVYHGVPGERDFAVEQVAFQVLPAARK